MRARPIVVLLLGLAACAGFRKVRDKTEEQATKVGVGTGVATVVGLAFSLPLVPVLVLGGATTVTILMLEDDAVVVNVGDGGTVSLGDKQTAAQFAKQIADAEARGEKKAAAEKNHWWWKITWRLLVAALAAFAWLRREWLWRFVRGSKEYTRLGSLWHAIVAGEKSRLKALKKPGG